MNSSYIYIYTIIYIHTSSHTLDILPHGCTSRFVFRMFESPNFTPKFNRRVEEGARVSPLVSFLRARSMADFDGTGLGFKPGFNGIYMDLYN